MSEHLHFHFFHLYSTHMAYFVNKSFDPEMNVKTFGKTLIGALSRICETKCHSARKEEIKIDEVFIPRWEGSSLLIS